MRGKSHRKEVAKKLQEQIAATTDPKLIIELSNQLSKFLPRPRQARRPRKPEATSPSAKTWWGREIYTGSVFDAMTDNELIVHHMVVLCEKKKKVGECKTKAEREVVIAEVLESLPESQRAGFKVTLERDGGA